MWRSLHPFLVGCSISNAFLDVRVIPEAVTSLADTVDAVTAPRVQVGLPVMAEFT